MDEAFEACEGDILFPSIVLRSSCTLNFEGDYIAHL
jgi:hypothetical protein